MPDVPTHLVSMDDDDNVVRPFITDVGETLDDDDVIQPSEHGLNPANARRDRREASDMVDVPGSVPSDANEIAAGTGVAEAAASASSSAAASSSSSAGSSSAAASSSSSSSSSSAASSSSASSSSGPASAAAVAAINAFAPNLRTTRDPAGVSELLASQLARIQSEVLAKKIDGISDMAKFVQSVREEEINAVRDDRTKWTKALQQFNEPQKPKPVAGRRANAKPETRGINVMMPDGSFVWQPPTAPIAEEPEDPQLAAAIAASAAEAEATAAAAAAAAAPVAPPPPPVYAPSSMLLQCRSVSAHLLQWLQQHAVLDVLVGSHSHEEIVKRASPVLAFLQSKGALDFRKSVMSLWPATVGKHENFVRITYEVMAKIVQELTLPQIQELFDQVTAPLYGGASAQSGSSSSSSSSSAVANVASASASPVSGFVLSDYYLHFLADFTKNALKRTQFLWAEQQARENRGEADPIDADMPWPADAFNDNRAEGSAPIYAVKCFIDLLRRSLGGNGAASPAAPASLVIGLPADLHSVLVTQLLPECLGAFPKSPIVRDAKDPCSAIVCESSAGVAARILRQCFTQLFEEAYNPSTCLSVLRLADGVLRWFVLEKATVPGSFATSFVAPVSPPRESRQFVIGLVGDKVGSPIQLCVTLVTQHCKFVRGMMAATPAAVQANGDVQLGGAGGGLLHSALLQAIFDFFHGLLACAPQGDIKTSHLSDLWAQLVESAESSSAASASSPSSASAAKLAGPISPQDVAIFSYFLFRLVDDDVRQFNVANCPSAFPSAAPVGITDPFEPLKPFGADSPIPSTSTLRLRKPQSIIDDSSSLIDLNRSVSDFDDAPPAAKCSSAASRAKAKAADCGFDSDDAINEDDIEVEDLDEADVPARVHIVPSAVKALLTQLIGHSHAFFESAPATIKSLNPKHDSHTMHFVSIGHTNLEPVQLVLVRHLFFLANMYEPSKPVTPVSLQPHAKLERFDGALVGIQVLWNVCTGADLRRHAPGSTSVLSPPVISSSLRRDLSAFLIDLFTAKFVNAGMIVNQSPNIGAHKRAVIVAFLDDIWKKITNIVADMESDKSNAASGVAAALAQRLLLSLQLLDTYFEVDSKQYVSAFSSHVPPGIVGALSIFAGKFYNALFDLLQKFTSEPSAGRQRLGANVTGPITELIFKLVMKMPQPAVDESKAGGAAGSELGVQSGGWTRRIVDFKFSNPEQPDWNELFSSTSTISLLFSLQTALDWLKRPRTYGLDQLMHDAQSDSWRTEFCRQGGLRHLMGIFTSMEFDLRNLFYAGTPAATAAPATAQQNESSMSDELSSSASPAAASASSSSSDNVLSKRCVLMLLKFLVDLDDVSRWEQTYYAADDSKRNIADLPRYTQQLQTLITEAIKASKAPVAVPDAAAASSSPPPAASSSSSSIPAPGTLGSSFTASMGFLTPSPSPPAPSQLNRTPSQIAAAAVSPVPQTDILMEALHLYNALIVACIRQASPCDPAEKLAAGALAQVRWDPVLLSPSFFRMLLLDGVLHQPVVPFRTVVSQALEQLVEVCDERHPTYPRPLRWFFIELLNDILLHDPSIDWAAPQEPQSSLQCLLDFMILFLHCEVDVEETHANPKFIIARATGEFSPFTLASAMLDRAVRRPIHESAASGALMKPENTLCDRVLIGLLLVARECVDIVRWQTPAVWRPKGGEECANIQTLLADRWLRPIFSMLTQLPEMATASTVFTPGVVVNLPPKAKSYQSREACANLLKSLAFSNAATLSQVVSLLAEFQDSYLKGDPFSSAKEWEFKLPEESASASSAASSSSGAVPYLGMRNLGNTCYINALVQQLFMIPDLRRNIQRIALTSDQMPTKGDPKSSVALQLQEIIAALAPGTALSRTAPGTEGFCKSFKDWDGVSINPAIQEDSGIFFTRLVDKLNEELKGTPHAQIIRRSLCGTLCNQLIGTDPLQCSHTKESPEEFTTIQLEIKNKKTLEQSLQAYIVGETLMDKNAYKCNVCQKKVSTLRRTVIATLPPTLAFVLKRFEINYNTMITNKINDRLEFPTEINMRPFTLEGLKEREAAAAAAAARAGGASPAAAAASSMEDEEKTGAASAASSSSSSAARPLHPPSYYQYVLRGVVVHSGTVGGGHYYSYIQDRSASGTGGWYEMNDKTVRAFDFKAHLEAETFGGKDAANSSEWSMEKSRSGYILFYDRVKCKDVVSNELAQGTVKWRSAVRAVLVALRLRARFAKQRTTVSPGLSATDAKIRMAQLAALQSAYMSSVGLLQDGMAFNYPSGLQFHHELFRDCGFGLRFINDPLWHRQMTSAHQSIDLLRVGQYAFKHFLHIFVRSYSHTNLINNWKMMIKGAFEPRPDSAQPFPYEHVLPLAHWILEYMCYMKPAKPVEVIDAATAAAIAAASLPDKPASSSSSSAGKNAGKSKDDSSSTAMVVAGPVKTHNVKGSSSGASHKRGRSAEEMTDITSIMDWDELESSTGGGSGGDYSSQIPPLDAPTSLLFQNIISCPQTDVRDAVCEIVGSVATLIVGYENASKCQTLSPVMCTLVDHLCSFIPYLPFYASKALAGYLKLVYQLCRASELVVHRFLKYTVEPTPATAADPAAAASASAVSADAAAPAVAAPKPQPNDFVARILDLYLGGVLSKDNPCGNSINNMSLASAKMRTYYPLTRDSLQASSTNTWKRALWTLMRVFVTHADLSPLRVPPPEPKPAPAAAPAAPAASALATSSSDSALATEMQDVSLSDRVEEDKKEEPVPVAAAAVAENETMTDAPAVPAAAASASSVAASASRRASDASDDNTPDAPKPALSPNAVQLLRFPGLLKALITDSYAHQRFLLVKELLLELSKDNLTFSKCVIQALFTLVEDDGPSQALFTHVRDQLRIADAFAGARRLCVLEAWLSSLDSDQMFWTPTSNSLNFLLTFVTDKQGGQELVECMHQHIDKWNWLCDWIKLNKKMPSYFSQSATGVTGDKPAHSSAAARHRGSSSSSGSGRGNRASLTDAWRTGSHYDKPDFNLRPLHEVGGTHSDEESAASMMGIDDVDDDEDDAQSEPEEEKRSLRSPSTKRRPVDSASSSSSSRAGAAGSSKPKRPPSLMMKMKSFKPKDKYAMLSRMARGLDPTDDSEDAEFALPAAAADASSSSSSTLNLTGADPWEMEDPAAVALWHSGLPHNPRGNAQPLFNSPEHHRMRQEAMRRTAGNGASDPDEASMEDMEAGGVGAAAGVAGVGRPLPEVIPIGFEVDALRKLPEQPGRWEPATVVASLPGFDPKVKLHFDNDGDDADQDVWVPRNPAKLATRGSRQSQAGMARY